MLVAALILGSCLKAQDQSSSDGRKQSRIFHVSFSTFDQWTQCVRDLTGKPLLLARFRPTSDLSCPSSSADFNKQIEGKGVLVVGDKWDLLIGENIIPLDTPAEFWKSLTVKLNVKPWEVIEGSRQPSPSELEQLSSAALKTVRPSLGVEPPVARTTKDGHQAETAASINIELLFDIRRLSPKDPESIIGVVREEMGGVGDGRLIYGEFRDGKPVFLWDSPRLTTRFLNLKYRDVNHDGVEEILLMGFAPSRGTIGDLVIFTVRGEELSRQPGGSEGFAEPIVTSGEVKFVPEGHGGPDLLEIPDESNETRVEAYVLNQTYVKQSDESATTMNEQGMELMRVKNYVAAAAKFTEAFHLDPNVAEFANNVGFAWYRAGKLQDSVLWLQQAVSLDPERAVAYLNLGDAYEKLNNNAGARRAYTKYLELVPDAKAAPEIRRKLEALPPTPR
jgi:hypothetical protein